MEFKVTKSKDIARRVVRDFRANRLHTITPMNNISSTRELIFVYNEKGFAMGDIIYEQSKLLVRTVFVDIEHRGEGVARDLTKVLLNYTNASEAWVLANDNSKKLYENEGFKLVETRPSKIDGHNLYEMVKKEEEK